MFIEKGSILGRLKTVHYRWGAGSAHLWLHTEEKRWKVGTLWIWRGQERNNVEGNQKGEKETNR